MSLGRVYIVRYKILPRYFIYIYSSAQVLKIYIKSAHFYIYMPVLLIIPYVQIHFNRFLNTSFSVLATTQKQSPRFSFLVPHLFLYYLTRHFVSDFQILRLLCVRSGFPIQGFSYGHYVSANPV